MTRLLALVLVPIAAAVLLVLLLGSRPDEGWAPVTCPRCQPVEVELP